MFGLDDAIGAVSGLADDVIKRVWPDATEIEKAKLQQAAQAMQNQYLTILGQLDINKAEAGSGNTFSASWRPMIGYICGFGLAYSSIIEPIARFVASVCFGYVGIFPIIDSTITMQILFVMLGLAAARSYDKTQGTSK